jgi:hypothetical protein
MGVVGVKLPLLLLAAAVPWALLLGESVVGAVWVTGVRGAPRAGSSQAAMPLLK